MLQWLMDNAEGEEKEIRALVLRILTINFAAIHTSSSVRSSSLSNFHEVPTDLSFIS